MSKSKAEILVEISAMETKLTETLESVNHPSMRGVHTDIIRLMVPIQIDQLRIQRAIAEALPE